MGEATPAIILVVDDNQATLYTTSRVLRSAGFQVLEAGTGTEGLELAARGVDLMVLDVKLPDISGFEVCKKVRADPRLHRIPVIHLSATFVKDVDKVQGYRVGADGYLTHPVEPPVLVATVQAFLRTRAAEDETRRSESKFRAVFNNALSGISLLGADLTYLEVNPAMCAMLGRTAEELVGHTLGDFLSDPSSLRRIRELLDAHGTWQGSVPVRSTSDRPVHLEWSISKHSLPGVHLAVVTDVSERIQLEEERKQLLASERAARAEAERANHLKDDFLATLSHELRTPLNAIVNWAQVLQLSSADATQLRDGLRAIERNANVQARLIADLLDVSRIISGKLRLELQAIDPVAFVDSALDAILPTAHAKGVKVRKQLDNPDRLMRGDPARLQQVVWNLVSNAVKFTAQGGEVEVVLRSTPTQLAIVVRDTGKGIPPDLLPHVFERFRQGEPWSPRQDGLGLGLSIVRQIVEMHGGTVRAESAGEGTGATFTVHLPLEVGSVPAGQPERCSDADSAHARLGRLRIVIVDDDADSRAFLERILRERGAEVRAADSANEALKMIAAFSPHILVSDLGMPGRDGYDLIRAVRSGGTSAAMLPAIALTAFTGEEERSRALRAGFQVHLAKPAVASRLWRAIVELVGRHERSATAD